MSSTRSSHEPESDGSLEGFLGSAGGWVSLHRTWLGLFVSWIAPFTFLGVGGLVPALPWDLTSQMWAGLFAQLLLVLVWLVHDFWFTAHRNTAVIDLQRDALGDITVALIFVAIGAALLAYNMLPWWFIVPALGAIADAYLAPALGINNAYEKPYYPTRGPA